MRLLLIGPPGSGKGTQATRISEHYGLAHISSGELLREHVAQGTAIGRVVRQYLAAGDLAPDGVVMDVLRKPVETASRQGGYVLDGFPRTVEQAKAAYQIARGMDAWVQVALHLDVPHDLVIERILARGRAAGRADDNVEVIKHRLQVYTEATPSLLDYYEQREIVITIDGAGSVGEVTAAAIAALDLVRPRLS